MNTEAWALFATEELSKHNDWVGRTHIHKVLFLAQDLLGINVPAEFRLYHYGPYSFDVDAAIQDLRVCGLLSVERLREDYGPRYHAAPWWEDVVQSKPSPEDRRKLEALAAMLGNRRASELEIIATCAWAKLREKFTKDEAIVNRVHQLKPKYSLEEIKNGLGELTSIQNSLQESL